MSHLPDLSFDKIVGYKVHLSRAAVDINTHHMLDLRTVKNGKRMRGSPIPSEVVVSFSQFHFSSAKPNLTLIKIILDNDTDEITGLLARASCDSRSQDHCGIYKENKHCLANTTMISIDINLSPGGPPSLDFLSLDY